MDRLKVFISSTQTDLQPERDGVQALVEELGHECLRAETYDSPGVSPQEACRQMASDCDIYVGVFAGRYGCVVPDLGISATEMEYRTARDVDPGKIFVYVKDTAIADAEQRRFLAEVQDFSAGYFRHPPFRDPATLRAQVKRDLATWTTRRVRALRPKEIEARALRDRVAHPEAPDRPKLASVNISGNKLIGETKIDVRREGTNISDNLAVGRTQIEVGGESGPNSKAKKGKQPR